MITNGAMFFACCKLFYMNGGINTTRAIVMVESLYIQYKGKQEKASCSSCLFEPMSDICTRLLQNCNKVAYLCLKYQMKLEKNKG